MRLWRSLLFVPANQKRMLDKVGGLPADGFIFDLEDTVPPAEKANARAMSKETIAKTPGKKSWVRVNSVPSGYLHEDLEAFIGAPGLAGFVVPKQDSVGDVAFVLLQRTGERVPTRAIGHHVEEGIGRRRSERRPQRGEARSGACGEHRPAAGATPQAAGRV